MFRLLWIASIHTRTFMRRYMPSNIILDRVRTRRGPEAGTGSPCCLPSPTSPWRTGSPCSSRRVAPNGSTSSSACLWSGLKMCWIGPVSVVLLAKVARTSVDQETPITCRLRRRVDIESAFW